MLLVDSHCHLDRLSYGSKQTDMADVLAKAAKLDVGYFLCVSVTQAQFPTMLAAIAPYPQVFASCGVHPLNQDPGVEAALLLSQAVDERVVGIGETGLDYHWCKGDLTWQHQRFANHISAANQSRLPLIVHTRDAADDTMNMLKENQAHAGVIHCFTEDIRVAKMALDLGFYISFSGIVTFKNAKDIQAAAQYIPLDRMLIETDAPFLAPAPKRGKPNEPAYVRHTAEFIAQLRGDTLENIAVATTENFYRLFNKVPSIK